MNLKIFFISLAAFLMFLFTYRVFAIEEVSELRPCIEISHCAIINIKSQNPSYLLKKSIPIIKNLPRTKIIYNDESYIKAEAKTKLMRFIDDIEIKALPEKSILQIRSESRWGVSDLGVNKKRIDYLSIVLN